MEADQASFSAFRPWMVQQNLDEMMSTAFSLLDSGRSDPTIYRISPQIVEPGTVLRTRSGDG